MHVDYLTLACLRDEMDWLLGARVQQTLLVDELTIGLELYAGRREYLLLSAHPKHARAHLTDDKLRRGPEKHTPLLLLLRKWVRGARLVDITQPIWERMLTFHFEGEEGPCQLIAEIMGRYSNIILVGPDGDVLDAVKRIGPDLNRHRITLPAHPYQPPPAPPNRLPPPAAGELAIFTGAEADKPLHRLLTSHLLAISPTLAREIAARACGHPDAPASATTPRATIEIIAQLFAPLHDGEWQPHIAIDEDRQVTAFTPYRPLQFDQVEPAPGISAAMSRYFDQALSDDPYASARTRTALLLKAARSRIEGALDQLRSQLPDQDQIDTWRQNGELLLAYQHQVDRGADTATLPDYEGTPRQIPLDPTLTPVENAQAYFRRCSKAQKAAEEVPPRIEALEADHAYLDQLNTDLSLADSRAAIDAVRTALAEAGWTKRPRRQTTSAGGPQRYQVLGFQIYVGRNARQNEQVTFKHAQADDLWLHVRGQPGAHVVVKSGGQDVPESVLDFAAHLAAYHSPARRGESHCLVDITQRRFVRRIAGGRPGMVTYRQEQPRWVQHPDQEPIPPAETET
jgi:predicted ribosome quality control (RQC) complex YloA/Tae2 family protein